MISKNRTRNGKRTKSQRGHVSSGAFPSGSAGSLDSPRTSATSSLLTLPNEVLQLVAFQLVSHNVEHHCINRCCTPNIHRNLSNLGYTCRRMRAIVTPALYSSIKFILKIDYEYHIRKRIQLLWRTLDSHQNLGGYVRTLCLTKVIKWDWSPLLSLLPNLQHLTIPSGAAAILRSAKLPLLSSLYYIRTRNDPRTDFPWEVLFRPNMRRWTFCFSYDHGDYRALNSLNSPPLPLNCVARSSPLTHIAITIGSCATAGVLDELLNWPAELLSFSFKGGWGGVAPEELSRALATHRASLKHLRLPLFPGDYEAGNHLLGYLDLKRFERLESLELQWTEVQRHPWITVAEYLPPNLIDLALTHTIKQTFNAEQQKWLIGLASILKTQISSLQFLKLDKLRIQEMIDLKNYTPINAIEHAWSEVGVIVTWVNAG